MCEKCDADRGFLPLTRDQTRHRRNPEQRRQVLRIEPFVRLAAAIGLAEITARESGARQTGELRRNINQLLKDVLSRS